MKEKRQRLNLRLPETLYHEIIALAHQHNLSINTQIQILLDQAIHPVIVTHDDHLQEKLMQITTQLESLHDQREQLLAQTDQARLQLSRKLSNPPLEDQIVQLLAVQSLSELRIASELNEKPETIFLLLANLERQKKVVFDKKGMKWTRISPTK